MGSIGIEKILLLGIVLVIFFGPNKLPELGKALGKGIQEFKKASKAITDPIQELGDGEKKA